MPLWIPEKTIEEFFTKAGLTDAQKSAVKAALGVLDKAKDGMPEDLFGGANKALAKLLGFGATAKSVEEVRKGLDAHKADLAKTVEGVKSAITKLEGEKPSINDVLTDLAKLVDVTPTLKGLESLPPEIKAEWEAMQKSRDADRKEIEEMKKSLAQRADQATEREFIQKAEQMPNVPLKSDALGKLLHAVTKSEDDAVIASLEQLLKSVDEIVKQSLLFKEQGGGGPGATDESGIFAKVDALAKSLITKSEKPLTIEQARAAVLEADPKLYDQYNAQQPQ